MAKAAVFTMQIEADLHAEFLAAAEASHRPAPQVVRELMRDFVEQRRERTVFLERKVETARISIQNGQGRYADAVEADFVARRARILDQT